jgi:Zn-dependent protease
MEELSDVQIIAIMALVAFVGRFFGKLSGAQLDGRRLLRVAIAAINSAIIAAIAGFFLVGGGVAINAWVQFGVAGVLGLLERQVAMQVLMRFINVEEVGSEKKSAR